MHNCTTAQLENAQWTLWKAISYSALLFYLWGQWCCTQQSYSWVEKEKAANSSDDCWLNPSAQYVAGLQTDWRIKSTCVSFYCTRNFNMSYGIRDIFEQFQKLEDPHTHVQRILRIIWKEAMSEEAVVRRMSGELMLAICPNTHIHTHPLPQPLCFADYAGDARHKKTTICFSPRIQTFTAFYFARIVRTQTPNLSDYPTHSRCQSENLKHIIIHILRVA